MAHLSEIDIEPLFNQSIELLKQLIATPSLSKDEEKTAEIIKNFFSSKGVAFEIHKNNVWAKNLFFDESKPSILLNSHHDTVKPNEAYTLDPYLPIVKDGKLFGLGSNDAGGALVSLLSAFLFFYKQDNLKYNLIFAATAEEEISGQNGIASILDFIHPIDFALVGEPTEMNMAIAEKGLIVLDCISKGTASHAAHPNNDNAILNAYKDISWFSSFEFPKVSPLLGSVKMTVTIIQAGSQHNVVPDLCRFTVDVRTNELYTNEEIIETIQQYVKCDVQPRSLRLKSSSISETHEIVASGKTLGLEVYGSPTLSDQALLPFPSLKIGPGKSSRSHTADEFIFVNEIQEGIKTYINLLKNIL
jgi:acetylornithine deacetylase